MSTIDEVASTQWSLVTRRQLIDSGIPRSAIATLLRNRNLRPIRRRVYATCGSLRTWQQDLMALVLSTNEVAVASHASAARLWSFVHQPEPAVEVTILTDAVSKRRGVHRSTILPADDVATRDGIPCTGFERTLCDCSTRLSAFQLGRVLDDGLRSGDASLEKLERCAVRLDSGPGRRLSAVKALLSERDATFHPGGSASELHVLRVIKDAGLPAPVQQHAVQVGPVAYVLDFAWPDQRVFAEYYGLAVHSGASAVAHDSARLTALVGLGWRPLVFTQATPDREIVRSVENLLRTAPSDGAVDRARTAPTSPSHGEVRDVA